MPVELVVLHLTFKKTKCHSNDNTCSSKVWNTQRFYLWMDGGVWSSVVTCSSRLLKGHRQAEQSILSDTSLTRLDSRCLSSSGDLSSNSVRKERQEYILRRQNITGLIFKTEAPATIHVYLSLQDACSLIAERGSPPSTQLQFHHLGTSRKWSSARQRTSFLVFLIDLKALDIRNT